MRILVHGINYAPELTGIGKYSSEMCAWLAGRGHEVRVITAPPYYPEWQIRKGYRKYAYSREVIDGVRVDRCPLWIPRRLSGAKRILHLASFALSCLPLMLRAVGWRPHIIITIEPAFFCAPASWLTARLAGSTAWLHVQDLEIDAAFELGMLPPSLRKFVTYLERTVICRFDGISTISKAMRGRLVHKGIDENRCHLFGNWANCRTIHPLPRPSAYRQTLELPEGAFVALYSGNMGEKQGLEIIIDMARALLDKPDIYFVMCGDGAVRHRLESLAGGLSNMRWLPLQPVERLNELLNLADVHLLPQRANAADLVMPSKLTGMLASGKPVIATAISGTELAAVAGEGGLVVPPGDMSAFMSALLQLRGDVTLCAQKGAQARSFAERHFAVDEVLEQFEATIQRSVNRRTSFSRRVIEKSTVLPDPVIEKVGDRADH